MSSKFNYGNLIPVVFHLVLWTAWIGLPIINAGDHERFRTFAIYLIPATLSLIPLFLINTEWLIPRILRDRGVTTYLLSLLGLITVFSLIQYGIKNWWIPENIRFSHQQVFWSVIPVLFATAISTGYGFIVYMYKQQTAQQEEQEERLRSELSFLRSQISPHFIFNILNSIVYLTRSNPKLAEAVTIKLSELMRYMLYTSSEDLIGLDKELRYLQNYIELQQIRFEEDVDIQFEMQGQADGYYIDPMLLIPFVENAFKHGVGLIEQPVILIHIKIADARLQLLVENKISSQQEEDKDPSSGIGLRNVQRRLELLYPDTHHLAVQEDDTWYRVRLELSLATTTTAVPKTNKNLRYETPLSGS